MIEATRQVVEEAKRVGDKAHAIFAMGNLLGDYVSDLQLDEADALLADPLLTSLPPGDQALISSQRGRLLLLRGRRAEADAVMAEARRVATSSSDPQVLQSVEIVAHDFHVSDMDFQSSYTFVQNRFTETKFHPWILATFAMESAALSGRFDWITGASEMAAQLLPDPRRQRLFLWSEAMSKVLAGNDEGVDLARQVAEDFRRSRWTLAGVSALVAAARHLPADHPARAELADEARGLASAGGATALAEWVDRAVGAASPSS